MRTKIKQKLFGVLLISFMALSISSSAYAATEGWTITKKKGIISTLLGELFDCLSEYGHVHQDTDAKELLCKGAGNLLCKITQVAPGPKSNLSALQLNALSEELDQYVSDQVAAGTLIGSYNSNVLIPKEGTDILIPVYRNVEWSVVPDSDDTYNVNITTQIIEQP